MGGIFFSLEQKINASPFLTKRSISLPEPGPGPDPDPDPDPDPEKVLFLKNFP
jgi:hypothetical protein